jgi:DNA-directed RNA polymerase specialized sigma subunit
VTKEKLEQLVDLRGEIIQIEKQIERLNERECKIVQDKVQGSMKEWPYTFGNKVIVGYDVQSCETQSKNILKKKKLLEKRRNEAECLELEIIEFINSIKDSTIRRIFSMRYEQQMTWEQIGNMMGLDRTTVEKRCKKYLADCSNI